MSQDRRVFWSVLALIVLLAAALLLLSRVEQALEPELIQAWVAIQEEGQSSAQVGPMAISAHSSFVLHAVLEARKADGKSLYYTDANALRMHGQEISASLLRPWDRREEARILWFTVEGGAGYQEVSSLEDLETFRFEEVFRADWPRGWSVPGRVEPSGNRPWLGGSERFGTQRFHVRIECYATGKELTPVSRYRSWGAEVLPQEVASFPTVIAHLDGALDSASRVFGLSQLEPLVTAPEAVKARLVDWTNQSLAFSRLAVLRNHIGNAGKGLHDLDWTWVETGPGGPGWGEELLPGDLVRVGQRVAILYADQGDAGVLDREDLCLDFARGPAIRPLDEVFGDSALLEWAGPGR